MEKREQWLKDGTLRKVELLSAFAKDELQCTVGQLALAWCLVNENVSTVLLGATTEAQLEENLGSLQVALRMSKGHMAKIEAILGNKPEAWEGPGGDGMRWINTLPGLAA